jgi:outer membrane protein TolC
MLVLALGGCSRAFWRNWADRDTYAATEERDKDPRWALPRISIDTSPKSRLYDPYDPNYPAMPPDDPAADQYMRRVFGMRGSKIWHRNGDAPWIEDPSWRAFLPLNSEGKLVLSPDGSVELGLLNSREYQTQLENLYVTALGLTLNRFDFQLHWLFNNTTTYTQSGSGPTENDTLFANTTFGFSQKFAAGGQLAMDFLNTFMVQFPGGQLTSPTGTILINFLQPLLRNAGRYYVLEALTESERSLLYNVRSFAHYRKQFSFNIITVSFLQLLNELQVLRNNRALVVSKDQSYRQHEALFAAGLVDTLRVDQTLSSLQQAEATVITSEASLERDLDLFKDQLGLPPDIPLVLDDALLAPFQLNDPALLKVQRDVDLLMAEFRELEQAPPLPKLQDGFRRLKLFHTQTVGFLKEVTEELAGWRSQPEEPGTTKQQAARIRAAQQGAAKELDEIKLDAGSLGQGIEQEAARVSADKLTDGWESLLDRTRATVALIAQLVVLQTQIRVNLIRLEPVPYDLETSVRYARDNRLDLMNQQAQVIDGWRQVAVTANQLLSEIDLVFSGNIASKPGSYNPFNFSSQASSYSVGMHFDSPLSRVQQRNAYRQSQISYQQARRSYMALQDQIERAIREDQRQIRAARLNFRLSQQNLVTTARQVESARETLLLAGRSADPAGTLSLIQAQDQVLTAQNALIGFWVTYETQRYRLLLDMEALQVDERGRYVNEQTDRAGQPTLPAPRPVPP